MVMSQNVWKWVKCTAPKDDGERYLLTHTSRNSSSNVHGLNLWHITPQYTFFFTFYPNDKYHKKMKWTEDLFRELEANLRSPTPSVKVVRFAVNGMDVFSDNQHGPVPEVPDVPAHLTSTSAKYNPDEKRAKLQDKKLRRRLMTERAINAEPAPFVVYARFTPDGKEYAWNLTPDKPKRMGIEPGDKVLVWSAGRFCEAFVTRIEPADGSVKPTQRVKKKIVFPRKPA